MQRVAARNLIVGLFVLAGLGAVAYLSFHVGGASLGGDQPLTVYAAFDEIGGLKERGQVQIAGVKVGEVRAITLDEDYRARVELALDPTLEYPIDTSASIMTAGILGDRFVSLEIGGDLDVLVENDEIGFTESALVFERLIGKLVHSLNLDK